MILSSSKTAIEKSRAPNDPERGLSIGRSSQPRLRMSKVRVSSVFQTILHLQSPAASKPREDGSILESARRPPRLSCALKPANFHPHFARLRTPAHACARLRKTSPGGRGGGATSPSATFRDPLLHLQFSQPIVANCRLLSPIVAILTPSGGYNSL